MVSIDLPTAREQREAVQKEGISEKTLEVVRKQLADAAKSGWGYTHFTEAMSWDEVVLLRDVLIEKGYTTSLSFGESNPRTLQPYTFDLRVAWLGE